MRILSLLFFAGVSFSAVAAMPEKLEDMRPPVFSPDASDEPEVTIVKQSDLAIEEYRSGGRIYMIKVIPKVGPPYYLIDQRGDGKFARQESLDSGFRVPQWVIHSF